MKKLLLFLLLFCVFASAVTAAAAQLRVYPAKVSASGAANREEMQSSLQTLLASRLESDTLVTVSAAAEAEALLTVSYIAFGKVFSLEAIARSQAGTVLARAFVQGDSQEELIPAVGKLAEKLKADLAKVTPVAPPPVSLTAAPVPAAPVIAVAPSGIVPIAAKVQESGDIWRSQPLTGVMNLLAAGAVGKDGKRAVFIADNRHLYYYRLGTELELVAEKELPVYEKIIALDVLDTAEGIDIYLTVVANEQPASQIWQVKGGSLQQISTGLPYYFRVLTLPGVSKQLYIQKSGSTKAFAGDVYRAERKGGEIVTGSALKLPATATLYTFNQFMVKNGTICTVVITAENRLTVYDQQQREIWRSTEKYGGSELYMERQDIDMPETADQGSPKRYLNQRLLVTAAGEVLVGRNDAIQLIGKNWNLSNGAVFSLAWTGESLEQKWRTRATDFYMPDYYFDDAQKELLQLQVTGRPLFLSKGSTVLTVRKTVLPAR